jgi:hypothetical protein
MHRSSESIAALAGALAKAQTELTNPEKSLTATIRAESKRGGGPHVPLRPAVERPRYRPPAYARRYALFTLVGIAGEDDFDAPDLNCRPFPGGGAIGGSAAPDPASRLPGGGNRLGYDRTILAPGRGA